jgi:hypothetical protein
VRLTSVRALLLEIKFKCDLLNPFQLEPDTESDVADSKTRKGKGMPIPSAESFQLEMEGYRIALRLEDYETRLYITIEPLATNMETPVLKREKLEDLLNAHGIVEGVLAPQLEAIALALQKREPVADWLVAQGVLPEPGQDAWLEFDIKPFSNQPEFETQNAGQIDYHLTHLFDNVLAGQRIGVGHAAIPSRNGHTVTSKIIPTPLLQIHPIRAGAGVTLNPETHEYFAAIDGRVMYKENTLSVTEEFLVEHDVDYGIGHIGFLGYVHVRGEVLDGFDIRAQKGVTVLGCVGNCLVESAGDIELGSMHGHDAHARIRCGGNLKVGCLSNIDIECAGNIFIAKEASQCNIKCQGSVFVQGRFVGGSCVALSGIEAAIVGSEGGAKTILRAGIDFEIMRPMDTLWEKIRPLQKKILVVMSALEKALALPPEQAAQPTHAARKNKWEADLNRYRGQMAELEQKVAELHAPRADRALAKIAIGKELHHGVLIQLGQTTLEIRQSCLAPKTVVEEKPGALAFVDFAPLKIKRP